MAADFYPEGTTAMPFDDPQRSLVKIVALGGGGGGGGGSGQVVEYTGTDPSGPPPDPTKPALAYSQDGSESTRSWNTNTQAWI